MTEQKTEEPGHADARFLRYWPQGERGPRAEIYQFQRSLARTERANPAVMADEHQRVLKVVAGHHLEHSPRYRELANAAGVDSAAGTDLLSRLPILSRDDLAHPEIRAATTPAEDGAVTLQKTSGSSGVPMSLRVTDRCLSYLQAMNLREMLWYGWDPRARFAEVRLFEDLKESAPSGTLREHWRLQPLIGVETGPYLFLPIRQPLADQIAPLRAFEPAILGSFLRNLLALTDHLEASGERLPSVRWLKTLGEQYTARDRERLTSFWGVPISDTYGLVETGQVAITCPEQGSYHVMSETVIVEVLREDNSPCEVGEIGRVVVTSLMNRATPVIRYDTGDRAAKGAPCACGRTLPTLRAFEGKLMQMLQLADGDQMQFLPSTMMEAELEALGQCQVAQLNHAELELRYRADTPLSEEIERRAAARLSAHYGGHFTVRVTAMAWLPATENGKIPYFVALGQDGLA
jgi:phenylacetate-coenzyme A ligase PaaK-like adenylate-forming protein